MNEPSKNAPPISKVGPERDSLSCNQQIAFDGETAQLLANARNERRSMVGLSEIATARLQGLLGEARQDIGGLFTVDEISMLLGMFAGHRFSFSEIRGLPTTICDTLGIDFDRHEEFPVGPLINKLLSLDTLWRLALADAIEQGWSGTGSDGSVGTDAFASLRINLSTTTAQSNRVSDGPIGRHEPVAQGKER